MKNVRGVAGGVVLGPCYLMLMPPPPPTRTSPFPTTVCFGLPRPLVGSWLSFGAGAHDANDANDVETRRTLRFGFSFLFTNTEKALGLLNTAAGASEAA